MKKNRVFIVFGAVVLILALVAISVAGCAKPAPAPAPAPAVVTTPAPEVFKWRFHSYAPPGTVDYRAHEEFVNLLREMTDGRIDMTLLAGGAIVGYSEMLEALGEGTFEMSHNVDAFFAGLDPGFAAIWSMPGVWTEPREAYIWFRHFGGNEIYREAYAKYNVHFLDVAIMGAEPIMSKVPLRTLDDFDGLKIRTPPGLTHDLFVKLGAAPVALPGGEVYSALDTGLVDAAEFVSVTTNYGVGLHEVTDYILWPSFHGPTANCGIGVNMDAWNELPDDLKASLEAATVVLSTYYDYWNAAGDWESLEKMKAYGLEHTQLSSADMATIRAMGVEGAEAWKTKSEMSNTIISSVFEYMRLTGKM